MDEKRMYDITAVSKDNQRYICKLNCIPGKEQEELDKHMKEKGWEIYDYKIERLSFIIDTDLL
jgi:hypothetical protein